ncbi:hypothetical protein P2Q00_30470 [Streptomyces coacervatus]|nr:hypothetical protein [Streptomyces coacervatus]MDF2269720.1 hypothetical protein [Streptomyces coacervatus]
MRPLSYDTCTAKDLTAPLAAAELDAEVPDGFSADPRAAVESLRKIKEFARQEDVVVLPSHDPRAAARLANSEIYRPTSGPEPSAG